MRKSESPTPTIRRVLTLSAIVGAFTLGLHYFVDRPSSTVKGSFHLGPLQKKWHPPHPKKLHHGKVEYFTEDTSEGRRYRREFTIPCHYGMLVFNIGPAKTSLPYLFDVYDDGYIYSDNSHLCFFYPSYKGYQNGTAPFWMPNDPTLMKVPLTSWTKISHKINDHADAKEIDDTVKARGGDYCIMEKGDFYDPHYYQQLKAIVNSWSSLEEMEEGLKILAEHGATPLASTA